MESGMAIKRLKAMQALDNATKVRIALSDAEVESGSLKDAIKFEEMARKALADIDAELNNDDDGLEVLETKEAPEIKPFVAYHCDPVPVPVNSQQPAPGEKKPDFIDASGFVPGTFNVVLPGPSMVVFWCQDCGRKLAPRSIHDHWQKAHGDKYNKAALQNTAIFAMNKYLEVGGNGNKRGASHPMSTASKKVCTRRSAKLEKKEASVASTSQATAKAPKKPKALTLSQIFSQSQLKNPFFKIVDSTPAALAEKYAKGQWLEVLCTQHSKHRMSAAHYNAALEAINNSFPEGI